MNDQVKMEEQRKAIQNVKPKLLLHSCCAPCSSAVLERLKDQFEITIFYYNPNITDPEEFERRFLEQKRLLEVLGSEISLVKGPYDPNHFYELSKGLEAEKEGGKRCYRCYYDRMQATAAYAAQHQFDFFTTTLSISPYKNAEVLNRIGGLLEQTQQISYLYADFKKKNGYKRSIELSKEYGLYRQDYCGCRYSEEESRVRRAKKEQHS